MGLHLNDVLKSMVLQTKNPTKRNLVSRKYAYTMCIFSGHFLLKTPFDKQPENMDNYISMNNRTFTIYK